MHQIEKKEKKLTRVKRFLNYMLEQYSEPMVGYPADYARISLFGNRKDVC